MGLENLDEYEQLFFHSDHHWNIRGAWKAYEGIYNMIAPGYPGISPKLALKGFVAIPGVKFCGSYARLSLYPCQGEPFEYADVDLPTYVTKINGKKGTYGNRAAYLAGQFKTKLYTYHHGAFFGSVKPIVEYHFDTQTDRNLLLIGSSFTHAIQIYVAAHYKNAYVVDLRVYEDFSFDEFVKKNQIDDVICLEPSSSVDSPAWIIGP